MTVGTRIQLRRDTPSNWTSNNPVLSEGELGLELGTHKFKFGDGFSHWNDIAYVVTSGGGGGIDLTTLADEINVATPVSSGHTFSHTLGFIPGGFQFFDGAGRSIGGIQVKNITLTTFDVFFDVSTFSGKIEVS